MPDARAHWDTTYSEKAENRTSWFQERPSRSLALIEEAAPDRSSSILDVGAGASRLVDCLIEDGYRDLTLLDVSGVALARSKARLGARATRVSWIVADAARWTPERCFDVWHDRAVFHFLTDPAGQDLYLGALRRATRSGSAVILATFAPTGPDKCSGLPAQRYDAAALQARLGPEYALYAQADEAHPTPFGTIQDFCYAAFRRR